MKDSTFDNRTHLDAFIKTAQYLANLTAHEDVRHHIANVMVKFYGAHSAGFVRHFDGGEVEFHHLIECDRRSRALLTSGEIRESVCEVLQTGFLAWRTITDPDGKYTVVLLPIVLAGETAEVLLVGHESPGPVSKDTLNVYLAIAGLVGTTVTRLQSEAELKNHRLHLEQLVSDRTRELTSALSRLEEEITQHKQTEAELREIRSSLQELVEERTAELEKANLELRTYSGKLEQINRELNDFAFMASHDLQEPLRKIRTFGGLLLSSCGEELSQKGKEYLSRMESSTGRMSRLIDDLLKLSRVATHSETFREVNLNEVAEIVLDTFEMHLQQEGGKIEVRDLPTVEADRRQMEQLLQNLVGNAFKYHKPGEKPAIRLYGNHCEGNLCRIFIEDNGIGFEEIYLDRIFKPFQRLHGRESIYEGTGMGLAICRKIIERHGGSITAKSTPGIGSIFIVTLPIKQGEVPRGGREQAELT